MSSGGCRPLPLGYIHVYVYTHVYILQRLLEEKHRLHKAHQNDTSSVSKKAAYSNICKTVHTKLRDMQDSWLRKKTEEIQSFADRKDMKKFHDALKTIYGPKSSGSTTLLSVDGSTLLTDKEATLKRWAEISVVCC